MLEKRLYSRVFALVGSLVLSGGLAQAAVLYDATVSLANTDPTQLGRLSRDGITPDWSFDKDFPGVFTPTTSYHYRTFSVFVPGWFSFLQISIDSNNGDILGSVYDTSYNPNPLAANRGLDVNYLGDPGGSGNFFGNPIFFQVVDRTAANSPSGGTIILVLDETTTTGTGLNSPVGLLVEGFSDTEFDETTPEPLTSTLMGAGLLILVARYRQLVRHSDVDLH
jgi:hypothetical protein